MRYNVLILHFGSETAHATIAEAADGTTEVVRFFVGRESQAIARKLADELNGSKYGACYVIPDGDQYQVVFRGSRYAERWETHDEATKYLAFLINF